MPVATYQSIDAGMLKSIHNPAQCAYQIKIDIPECTFFGVHEQPDFCDLSLMFYPADKVIELKSLKHYVFQLRNIVVSYERLLNVMYQHLMAAYQPERLRLVMVCKPRGGISSELTIDSDWHTKLPSV
ncbi:MAG: 7-cyano-7-deazaguanine reductase [Pseudomonadota bacterium]